MEPTLIVITGPTASGKSAVAVDVARRLGCDVISADSRQIFRGIPIVTAAPTAEEMQGVMHHFVGTLPLDAYYSAAQFEAEALKVAEQCFARNGYAVVCGGSMMYIDALTDGIDDLPDISPSVRGYVARLLEDQGPHAVMAQLEIIDPEYAAQVDPSNTKRVAHALEISLAARKPYSELRRGTRRERPFRTVKVMIDRPREELFGRINRRVEAMVAAGLLDEARRVYPLRHLNSLNTVGLKELFAHFDGLTTLDTALERIAKNTRVYAKKQLTWLGRPGVRPAVKIASENAADQIIGLLRNNLPR